MKTQINSLAELEAEKQKIIMQMEVSKRAFFHTLGYTKTQAKDFLVKKVALPAGALGIATVGINAIADARDADTKKVVYKNNNHLFLKAIPIILPMIRAYMSTSGTKVNLLGFLEKIIAPQTELVKEPEMPV